ncbi:lipase [Trichosporon asahii var. asahii CBS 8904]|uniref:Lipase n=3 Tax=Trichosporon asahii var. asahii TaxID=189963 RepID=K1VLA8_TRIAC|nr:lipase [Trichosporon asahii var. asahii CBS 2479]AGN98127.1 lipase B [Trichosporon asahii var. asahii]EJT52648.1 lipase [Trichosporon asahii var. asahii CBS 2479]EKD00062.1 lipase [Trichosporon asahii var. asahii CBS 8904]
MLLKTLLPLTALAGVMAGPIIDERAAADLAMRRDVEAVITEKMKAPTEEQVQEANKVAQGAGGGFNDWNCKMTDDRTPIIFLHGLTAPSLLNWFYIAPTFSSKGHCVYTPQYGTKDGILLGFNSLRDSSKWLKDYVQKVKASTGAGKVHLVGHSMGTTVSSYYMKFDGGADQVDKFVGFGCNYRGTSLYGINQLVRLVPFITTALIKICPSCNEFLSPSDFMNDLQRGGIAVDGPQYTNIVSKYDELVLPYTSGIMEERANVENIVLQDRCHFDFVGHSLQAIDPNVKNLIEWAIDGKQGPKPGCVANGIPFVHIRDGLEESELQ